MTVQEILTAQKLNWTVKGEGLQTLESGIVLPKTMAVVREDTLKVLGTHGSDYGIYQNEQLLELLFQVSNKTGMEIHRGGFFGEGEKVYIQLKGHDLKIGNDRVEGYITGVNTFDGSAKLGFGSSTITISCQNTFFKAFRALENSVKHTKNMLIKLEDLLQAIDLSVKEEKVLFDHIERFAEIRMSQADMDKVTRQLFNIKKEQSLMDFDAMSTKMQNQIAAFKTAASIEISDKGDNLWGLFSGVTRFTTHNLPKSQKTNDEQKMFGHFGKREQEIFEGLAELVA